MPRLLVVANPSASGFTGALHREVVATLAKQYEVTTVWPDEPDGARRAASEAAVSDFDVVVAMGGDGVVHHVANGLAGTNTALAVIPTGTTNVFARILGTPRNPRRAASHLAEASNVRTVPLAHATTQGPGGPGTVYGTFALGMGFDAEVVQVAERRPSRKLTFGGLHYARSSVAVLWSRFRNQPATLRVEAAGARADAVAVMVQVHWPYTYFGPIPLRFAREPIAGVTVLVLERITTRSAASLFLRAAAGRSVAKIPGAQVWSSVSKLIVEAEPVAGFQADGELLGSVAAVEVAPAAERLLVLQ